ncbi:MAG: NAD-dependent epimerase/dehydratase family protein [Clostridiales bacterium]|nr:NAD-dependent epimerase/dehydratase family protein [Clostridiales bacterium]
MYEQYLITGATSPVGRLVTKMLADNGSKVRILIQSGADRSPFEGFDNIEIFEGEVFDKDSMKDFFKVEDPRHSVLIHMDEIVSASDKTNLNMRRVNVAGTQHVVDLSIKNKIGRMVWLGSAYALNPKSSLENSVLHFDRTKVEGEYAKTKAEAGAYIIEKVSLNKFNAVILLPTFIIGPGYDENSDMKVILKHYIEKGVSTVKGGHAFVDVRDVADGLLALSENGQVGGCYILSGEHRSTDEFFEDVKKAGGIEKDVKPMPKWMMSKSLGKFVDTYYRITKKDNPKEVYALFMNNPDVKFNNTMGDVMPDSETRSVTESLGDVLNNG